MINGTADKLKSRKYEIVPSHWSQNQIIYVIFIVRIDFNTTRTCPGLFYNYRLFNRSYFTFVFTFVLLLLKSFFAHSPIEQECF